MKNLFVLFAIGALFTFVACNEGGDATEAEATEVVEEATEAAEEATEEATEAAEEAGEELAEHVCNDNCVEGQCHFKCGEKGHTCSDACHSHEGGDDHDRPAEPVHHAPGDSSKFTKLNSQPYPWWEF